MAEPFAALRAVREALDQRADASNGIPNWEMVALRDVDAAIAQSEALLKACRMVAGMAVAWEALTPGDIAEVRAAIAKAEAR